MYVQYMDIIIVMYISAVKLYRKRGCLEIYICTCTCTTPELS